MRNYITTRINELHLHTNRLSKRCIRCNCILHKYKTRQSQSTQDVRLVVTIGARVWLEEGKRCASGMCNLLFLIDPCETLLSLNVTFSVIIFPLLSLALLPESASGHLLLSLVCFYSPPLENHSFQYPIFLLYLLVTWQ